MTIAHIRADEYNERIRLAEKTGLCFCDSCVTNRSRPANMERFGKPLPGLEEIQQMEEAERRATENFKNIKIVNGKAQCQNSNCKRLVKLIPQGTSTELEMHEKRRLRLQDKNLSEGRRKQYQLDFNKFQAKLERRSINRIPLYRVGRSSLVESSSS
jgi:hypothetical protein